MSSFSKPTSSFGYYRGAPAFNGEGSGMGPEVSGTNQFSQGQGSVFSSSGGSGNWTPDILYMFVLVLIEMAIFAFLSRRV